MWMTGTLEWEVEILPLWRGKKEDNKDFLSDQCKETEENNRMEKTRDLFKKLGITRESFMQIGAQ